MLGLRDFGGWSSASLVWVEVFLSIWFSIGTWLSGWLSFLLVILTVFSVLLLDLSFSNGSFLCGAQILGNYGISVGSLYISTLVIVYPIFVLVEDLGMLELRIYVFVRIVWLFI